MRVTIAGEVTAAADPARPAGTAPHLAGTLVAFGRPGDTPQGRFVVPGPDSITVPTDRPVPLLREHDSTGVAAGLLADHTADRAALTGRFRLLDTGSGRDALVEASAGVRTGLSVGLDASRLGPAGPDGTVPILAATLREVSLVRDPAFPGSGVDAVEATRQEHPVPELTAVRRPVEPVEPVEPDDDQTTVDPDAPDLDDDQTADDDDQTTATPDDDRPAGREPGPVAVGARRGPSGGPIRPTAPTPGEIAAALYMRRMRPDLYDRTVTRITAAAPHTLSTDLPGLMQKTILDVLYAGAPVVAPVWESLPSLPVRWGHGAAWTLPKVTTHLPAAATAAEKTDVTHQFVVGAQTGTAVMLKQAVNLSEEAIDWSDPAAWDIALRELARSMMLGKETLACTKLLAGATATPVTGTKWVDTLVAAATAIVVASGYPANTVWWSPDAYGKFQVALAGLVPAQVNYADQPWVNVISPTLPASTVLMGHRGDNTAGKLELGQGTLTVPEPALIAQSAGIFATVDAAVIDPTAFVKITPTPAGDEAAAASSKNR